MAISTKDQVWEQAFNLVQDKRVDSGIRGVVLGLNAHGVKTTFSCGGHLDHGLAYPWVWVRSEDQAKLAHLLNVFNHQGEEEGYEAMDRMLIILCNFIEDTCVLQSFGAVCQNERKLELKAEKLKEYQQEMHEFGLFLKSKFFSDEPIESKKREYTTFEASQILGVEHQTVVRNILRGNISAVKRGRDYVITSAEFERFKNTPRRSGRPSRVSAKGEN